MIRALIALVMLSAAGCAKSTCEKYAEMEWKCGDYPPSQKEITLELAKGFCEAADQDPAMKRFAQEAACVAEAKGDCAAYERCTAAVGIE